jgi:hypothetical protein
MFSGKSKMHLHDTSLGLDQFTFQSSLRRYFVLRIRRFIAAW